MNTALSNKHKEYLDRKHFGSLDGVRCLAIVAVIWHHSGPQPTTLLARGFLGVDLFFVLSGFLIVTLLLREKDQRKQISLRDFYMRRSLRIFPIYYGLLLALAVLYLLMPGLAESQQYFQDLPYFATYTSNWLHTGTPNMGMTWSLAAEEQFYLLWPLAEKFLPPLLVYTLLAAFLAVNQAINYGLTDNLWRSTVGSEPDLHILDATFTPILLGVLLAHLLHHGRSFACIYHLTSHKLAGLLWGALLITAIHFAPPDISGTPRLIIQLLMTIWLGSLVVHEKHLLARPLGLGPIARIGAISYGMYLFHMFALHIARETIDRVSILQWSGSLFLLGLVITLIMAEISYRFYETPFLKLKHRFAWQQKPTADH
ncbi:acyltransferase family protein [Mucisphaera sp.]|uniref:acyltransferase family protein n=1 Tax=Mucisphaera sp. TaxID=2913024 RepID=UPI003D0DD258